MWADQRVDALRHAIEKAKQFEFDLNGAVMASDAFFPFNDCVQIGHQAGITAFIQPGGSVRDKDSIEYCREHKLAMIMKGVRHFKHKYNSNGMQAHKPNASIPR